MLNLNKLKIDPKKRADGTYWGLNVTEDGKIYADSIPGPSVKSGWVKVVVAGLAFDRAVGEAQKPFIQKVREGKRLTPSDEAMIEGQALIDGEVLVDWGNLVIGSEDLGAFTPEKGKALLCDPAWETLRLMIRQIAENRRALLADLDDQAEGNSSAGCDGGSPSSTPTGIKSS